VPMPKKLMIVLALVAVMVPLLGAAALAHDQLIQCRAIPCYGTGNDDKILERIGNGKSDKIIPGGGYDLILANKYGRDIDVVKSSKGWDKIKVNDNDLNDTANAGKGRHDWCIVDARSEVGRGCNKVTVR
jgi:hypothetical protein